MPGLKDSLQTKGLFLISLMVFCFWHSLIAGISFLFYSLSILLVTWVISFFSSTYSWFFSTLPWLHQCFWTMKFWLGFQRYLSEIRFYLLYFYIVNWSSPLLPLLPPPFFITFLVKWIMDQEMKIRHTYCIWNRSFSLLKETCPEAYI